jgi:hypothetical protein
MERNYFRTGNAWFLFFVTQEESFQVSNRQDTVDMDSELISTISLNEDESQDQGDSSESTEEENENLTESDVDPARTRGVDPARTRGVDPARTRVVDPARTRGGE